jgi:amino acid transporter
VRDPISYRIKKFILGTPLNRHSLGDQRLSNKNSFGILGSNCVSSSAYGGEQILVALIPAFGLAAFAIFTPLVTVLLVMLVIVAFSYRDVINTYTRSGGAYVVARENLGVNVSLVAAIELMFGYIITVAIQAAAGVAAVISAFPALSDYKVQMTLSIIVLLTFVNLRGVKDAGTIFVLPSYIFIGSMLVVFIMGIYRKVDGSLPEYATNTPGLLPLGEEQGLITFAAILMILKAFANGSASLTGLEAVSDSVSLFRSPEHVNARRTFTLMAITLATLIIGIGWLAHQTFAVPYQSGTPTVISLVAKASLGSSLSGEIFYYIVQAGTMLILFAGANTCYTAFPNMVNVIANDGFLPKRLTARGHRLVFSSGILFIAVAASVLVLVSGASITVLAAIYAIAVFIGFTLTGFGMAKKTLKDKAKIRSVVHILAGSVSAITVLAMRNFNKQYRKEKQALLFRSKDARATTISRHNVTVLVDTVDIATITAVRYARSLKPHTLQAVHFVLDDKKADEISHRWSENPAFDDVPLELVDCPDRRLPNAALEYAVRMTLKPDIELTLLLPRRAYSGFLGRLLHDQTAEKIAAPISHLQRVVATIVPFDVSRILSTEPSVENETVREKVPVRTVAFKPVAEVMKEVEPTSHYAENMTPIGEIQWRKRAHVQGRVTSIKSAPRGSAPYLQVEVWDQSGGVTLQFLGRREIAGLDVGSEIRAEGMVGEEEGSLLILNPSYELLV